VRLRIAIPEENVRADVLESAAEAVTRLDEQLLRSGTVPSAETGITRHRIKWEREPPGEERFDHAGTVMGRGWGDCDDLAPWHAASLRVSGEDPGARVRIIPSGYKKFHAMVQRSDGSYEDPSIEAGMPTKRKSGEVGIAPAVCGVMFHTARPQIALKRGASNLWYARADLPWGNSGYNLSSLHGERHPIDAVSRSIEGVCCVGEAAGIVDRDHVARLLAVEAMARGVDPNVVLRAFEAHGVPFKSVVGDLLEVVSSLNQAAKMPPPTPRPPRERSVTVRF